MIIICIILLIFLLPVLIFGLREEMLKDIEDRKKNPWRYQKRSKRRSNNHLPPLTAWTWWMYAEKNSGRFPDSEWRRQYSRGRKRK